MSIRKYSYRFLRLFYPVARPGVRFARKYYAYYRQLNLDGFYNSWAIAKQNVCFVETKFSYKPLISIVVPVFNPSSRHFVEMVYSVINQHYDNWELVLVNASAKKSARALTEECALIDDRIKIINLEDNLGISDNTNAGINQSQGEFIAFVDHDDLLHPCALHSVVAKMQGSSKPDLIYTDEDKVSDDSDQRFNPHFKPDWSPDLLENVNYINHLSIIRKDLIIKVGGLQSAHNGAQDYDLLWRVIDEYNPIISHVSQVLYSWRASKHSTARDIQSKKYIFNAGVRTLKEHIKRKKIPAKVINIDGKPGFYKLIYEPVDFSIVIGEVSLSMEEICAKWLTKLLKISKFDGKSIELVIGDWYKKFENNILKGIEVKYIDSGTQSYWQEASRIVSKPVAVCFKVAALPKTNHGLARLAATAAYRLHDAVSPILVNTGNIILDSGIVNYEYLPRMLFEGFKYGINTNSGNTDWARNVDDLTTKVVALTKEKLLALANASEHSYDSATKISTIAPKTKADNSRFVIWAHSVFDYKGLLKPYDDVYYFNSQLSFLPTMVTLTDNWEDDYVREKEL